MEEVHQLRGDRREELSIQQLPQADLVLLVTDIVDFEGTFSRRLALQCGPRMMVVANKADLLPSRTAHAVVLAWLVDRLETEHIVHAGAFVISALESTGLTALCEGIRRELNTPATLAIVGADRVGKSTLLQVLSSMGEQQAKPKKRVRRRSKAKRRKKAVAQGV